MEKYKRFWNGSFDRLAQALADYQDTTTERETR